MTTQNRQKSNAKKNPQKQTKNPKQKQTKKHLHIGQYLVAAGALESWYAIVTFYSFLSLPVRSIIKHPDMYINCC